MKTAIGTLAVLCTINLALSIAALGRWSDLDARTAEQGRMIRRQAQSADAVHERIETLARLPAEAPAPSTEPAPPRRPRRRIANDPCRN